MSTTLTDLDHRVSVLEDLFKQEIHPKIESMDRTISQVSDRTEDTREEVRAGSSSIHNDIRAFRDEVGRRFRDSDAGINARFDAVDGCFTLIDDQFKEVHDQFKGVHQRFEKVDEQFIKIDQRFEKVDDQFKEVHDQFKDVNTKLDEVLEAVRSGRAGK